MVGAKFPLPIQNRLLGFGSMYTNVPANATSYLFPTDQGGEGMRSSFLAVESMDANYLVTHTGLLSNLMAYVTAPPGVGQTFVYTVRVNGTPTTITCTIAGAVNRLGSDLVNTAKVVVGDRITVQVVASVTATATKHYTCINFGVYAYRIPIEHVNFTSVSTTIGANVTGYITSHNLALGYFGGYTTTETIGDYGKLISRKGTLKNLVVLAGAAPGAAQTFVYTIRVNAINTAMIVTLSGAAQVTGTDIVNVAQVDPGDRISLRVVTSVAATVATHAASFDFEEGDYRAG